MEGPHDALSCPITLEIFRDPVRAQDGHTYERKAIEEWIRKNGTSPFTNQKLSIEQLTPNCEIKNIVDHFENSLREKGFQYILDVDIRKKKGQPLWQGFGKTIYHAEWLRNSDGRPNIILSKIDGARANKEASFYVELSRHSHIVRTFGIVGDKDDVCDPNSIILLQEYASGRNLLELLLSERRKPLDEKILINIFLQIIDAMSHLALNHVVHGDLACRNVLLFRFDEDDPRKIVVKVSDFGLSRHSKIYTTVATVARTTLTDIPIRYSAPEILSTNVTANDYTEKSDVYAMGVLMWEAYSRGTIHWTNVPSDEEVSRRVQNGEMLSQPANCSSQYWNIIKTTWHRQPDQRPTFDQLQKLLKEQMDPTSVPISEPSRKDANLSISNTSNTTDNTASVAASTVNNGGKEEIDALNLVDSQISFNKQICYVISRVYCNGEYFYVLQSDKPMTGYDGLCPKCRSKHVPFYDMRRFFYASVKSIHDELTSDEISNERSQGPKSIDELTRKSGYSPPLSVPVDGKYKGIEGDANSCYMDATIFCMFAYSRIFDTFLNKKISDTQIEKVQTLLRENIVNVLRSKAGFVERDALYILRSLLSEATRDTSFIEEEKDPSEFLRALENLFHFAPLKTIQPDQPPNSDQSNITTNIMWEMFDANVEGRRSTNIRTIFRNSLTEIPAKLATIPPFLILVAPRHSRTERSYRYIIPDRQITLDDKMVQLVCRNCQKTNHGPSDAMTFYSCYDCSSKNPTASTDAFVHSICCDCLAIHHKPNERITHNVKQMDKIATLNLFAVLCIERCHYVAFVKCHKRNDEHEWLFFDSMSDRVANEKNVPCVSRVPDFEQWIKDAQKDDKLFDGIDRHRYSGKPTAKAFPGDEMKKLRLFRDGAFFFYENSTATYQ